MTFPWRVYRGDHLWVPPLLLERKAFLNPRKNPFFQHAQVQLFLAQQGKETMGRIAAVMNEAHDSTPWGLLRFWYQRRRLDTLRIAILGVKKRYRRLGIDLMLYVESWKQAATLGIVRGEGGWVLEGNHLMIRALEELGAFVYKRYRLYQKELV